MHSIGSNIHSKILSQTDSIKVQFPRYFLFCDAIEKKGSNSSYEELAAQMVLSSTGTVDYCPQITISAYQLRLWFLSQNGKEISAKEKPLDTKDHCIQQKDWVINHYG